MASRLAVCLVFAVSCGSTGALPAPDWLRGVVWTPPADDEMGTQDLRAMEAAGFRAVRVPFGISDAILSEADRLGFAVYVELSAENLPATRLRQKAPTLQREFDAVLELARRHRSLRHVGLANGSDTSDPRSCEVIGALAETARTEGPSGMSVYYVTRFPSTDRCVRHADLLLVGAIDKDPLDVLTHIRSRIDVPVGLAAYGAPVEPGREGGWRAVGSEAHQARILENAMNRLSALTEAPAVVFYYRWRDQRAEGVATFRQSVLQYGLLTAENEPRLAFEVARGMLTGEQTVFAIDAGERSPSGTAADVGASTTWMLLGWLVLLGAGLMAAGIPHFDPLMRHYFSRKDLFREDVQRGADLGRNATLLLAVLLSLAFGIVVATASHSLGDSSALSILLEDVDRGTQMRLAKILQRPIFMVLVLAVGYALWIVLNQLWLSIVRGRTRRVRPTQVLSLVVWPRWMWFLLMVLSLLIPTIPERASIAFALGLLLVGILAEFRAGYRAASDYAAVIRMPAPRLILVGFAAPALVFAALGVALLSRLGPELVFLWNLATRS